MGSGGPGRRRDRIALRHLAGDQLCRLGAGGRAAVGVLLDPVAHVPQVRDRRVIRQVESGHGPLRRPVVRHPARRRRARSMHRRQPQGRHRRAPMRDRPNRGQGCASPAGAETTRVRYEPARKAGPTVRLPAAPQGRRRHCRSGPVPRRRPHVTTADAVLWRQVTASVLAGRRTRRRQALTRQRRGERYVSRRATR